MTARSADRVVVAGTVTWDVFGTGRRAGGAVSFIARVCEMFDARARMLIGGGPDAPVEALEGHAVVRLGEATQTFRHGDEAGRRRLDLDQAVGRTLRVEDVPADWVDPDVLILAPLMPEDVDVTGFLDEWPAAEVGLLAQGLQRVLLPGARETANRVQPSSVLLDAARPNVSIFLSEDEVRLWPTGTLPHLAARCARLVVTEGARGARVYGRAGSHRVEPVPAQAVDTTGAGDTFAAAFILALRSGAAGSPAEPPETRELYAGRFAAACAAAAVEVRGPGPLPPRAAIEARMSAGHGGDVAAPAALDARGGDGGTAA